MKYLIFVLFLLLPFCLFSQTKLPEQNIWTAININQKYDGKIFKFDCGYRTYNYFNEQRTVFSRGVFLKEVNQSFSLGGGVAYFNNYSFSRDDYFNEFRPFIETNINLLDILNIRLRNEWRIYEVGYENENRFRVLFSNEQNFNKFCIKGSFEYFYTNTLNDEYRYTISNKFRINENQNITIFYGVNRQSKIKMNNNIVNQLIMGIIISN